MWSFRSWNEELDENNFPPGHAKKLYIALGSNEGYERPQVAVLAALGQ